VVVVSTGMEGDAQKDLTAYSGKGDGSARVPVENYAFDDSQLKTLGLGKQTGAKTEADGGSIQILIFSGGTEIPAAKPSPSGVTSTSPTVQPAQVTAEATQNH
jgi:hypothetical protein